MKEKNDRSVSRFQSYLLVLIGFFMNFISWIKGIVGKRGTKQVIKTVISVEAKPDEKAVSEDRIVSKCDDASIIDTEHVDEKLIPIIVKEEDTNVELETIKYVDVGKVNHVDDNDETKKCLPEADSLNLDIRETEQKGVEEISVKTIEEPIIIDKIDEEIKNDENVDSTDVILKDEAADEPIVESSTAKLEETTETIVESSTVKLEETTEPIVESSNVKLEETTEQIVESSTVRFEEITEPKHVIESNASGEKSQPELLSRIEESLPEFEKKENIEEIEIASVPKPTEMSEKPEKKIEIDCNASIKSETTSGLSDEDKKKEDSKLLGKREMAIMELCESEDKYRSYLESIVNKYKPTLEPLITVDQKRLLFTNIEPLILVSKQLSMVFNLESEKGPINSCIAKCFQSITPLIKFFVPYIEHYPEADLELQNLLNSNKKFAQQCDLLLKEGMQPITSLIIMPVQRMPKYFLLIKEIMKSTPKWHSDSNDLPNVMNIIKDASQKADAKSNEAKRKGELFSLQNSITDCPPLVSPTRALIGRWALKEDRQEIIVFSDLLLRVKSKRKLVTRKSYIQFKNQFDLKSAERIVSEYGVITIFGIQEEFSINVEDEQREPLLNQLLKLIQDIKNQKEDLKKRIERMKEGIETNKPNKEQTGSIVETSSQKSENDNE